MHVLRHIFPFHYVRASVGNEYGIRRIVDVTLRVIARCLYDLSLIVAEVIARKAAAQAPEP